MNATARRAFDFYVAKGVPPVVAAAIVGNLFVESGGFAPDVLAGQRKGDTGSAWYAPQLRGSRKAAYDRYVAAGKLDPTSLEAQLAFVLEEMDPRSPYRDPVASANRDEIFAAGSVDEATRRFMTHYERPNPDAAINHIARRIAAARGVQNYSPDAGSVLPAMLAVTPESRPLSPAEANAAGDATATPFLPQQAAAAPQRSPGMAALAPNGLKGGFSPVGNFVARGADKVDPRLVEILKLAAEQAPGYRVEAFSGYRPGDKRFHGKGSATDVRLVDLKTGKELPNYQNAAAFREYEKFAQTVRRVQMERYPELTKDLRWGGYFSGKRGVYGALDTMHFDLGGRRVGMAGGSWETGLTPEQRRLFPGVVSEGMGATPAPRLAMLPDNGPVPPARPAPFEEIIPMPAERTKPVTGAIPMPAERSVPLAEPGFFRPSVPPGSREIAFNAPFSPAVPPQSRAIASTPPASPFPAMPAASSTIAGTVPPMLTSKPAPMVASASPSGGSVGSALGGLLSGIANAISAGMAQTAALDAQGAENFENAYRRTLGPSAGEIAQQMPTEIARGELDPAPQAVNPFAGVGELTPEELVASLFGRPVTVEDPEKDKRRKALSLFG